MNDPRSIPDSALTRETMDFARLEERPEIFAHSMRVFLHARTIAAHRGIYPGSHFDLELLFVASALHDIGTADRFDGPQRFEVAGADAATDFLKSRGFSESDTESVWDAIALHTSPGIAERRGPLTLLVRLGVLSDFGRLIDVSDEDVAQIEAAYPRGEIEQVLASAVIAQCITNPAKAPASSWPGGLYRAHLAHPGRPGINPAF
jgi:hypothetical protein